MNILEIASQLASTMYANEVCRICGKIITAQDAKTAVFVGYSENKKSRAAHMACSLKHLPKEMWAYPTDL